MVGDLYNEYKRHGSHQMEGFDVLIFSIDGTA